MASCRCAREASRWRLMSVPASSLTAPMASPSRASKTPTRSNASWPPCARPTSNLQSNPMIQYDQPDSSGHFGPYGGSFASETLTFALRELRAAWAHYQNDAEFQAEYQRELAHFVG